MQLQSRIALLSLAITKILAVHYHDMGRGLLLVLLLSLLFFSYLFYSFIFKYAFIQQCRISE